MTTISHDINEPLTYANAPTYEKDGAVYLEKSALREFTRRVMIEDKDLLDSLATK